MHLEVERQKDLQSEISALKSRHEEQIAKIRASEAGFKKELQERDEKLESLMDELRERDSVLDKQATLHKGL